MTQPALPTLASLESWALRPPSSSAVSEREVEVGVTCCAGWGVHGRGRWPLPFSHPLMPPFLRSSNLSLFLFTSSSPSFPPTTALGAAYGTAKSGVGIAAMSVMRPDLIMKSVIPVVMAGIIAIYGLVVSVLIANKCK